MIVGTVFEIWRYPVKSMGGGTLDRVELGPEGIPGDRGWALRDDNAREVRGAKKLPALLGCEARYVEEPRDGVIPPAEIRLPDGSIVRSESPAAAERLSALVGRPVTIWPRRPPDDLEHYRRHLPENPEALESELRSMFGREKGEPLPDLGIFPPELLQFTSPLGTYFDAFPLHLVTTASLDELKRRNPEADFDRRRFRPNLLVGAAAGVTGFVELDWCGKRLRVGTATIEVTVPCVRCVMTTLEQPGLSKNPAVLRTIVGEAAQNVGVYAKVVTPGTVKAGDPLELLS